MYFPEYSGISLIVELAPQFSNRNARLFFFNGSQFTIYLGLYYQYIF